MSELKEIIMFFLKLGCLGFGGPIATMAMMESDLVQKRRWVTEERFARAYALIKVLPGAAAIQMSIYLGQAKSGRLGGCLAGISFILPSFLIVLVMSIFYSRFHGLPHAESLFQGMQIAALVIILDSVYRMAKPYAQYKHAVYVVLVSAVIIFIKPSLEPLLILGFGILGAIGPRLFLGPFLAFPFGISSITSGFQSPLAQLTMVCFKAGAFVFGTGLAIIPILEHDVVGKYHWLTHAEFLDGLAIGQVTPGPVVITSTFIGYRVAGILGASLATLAIVLPGFINILFIVPPFERRLVASPSLSDFTRWAIPAVIGGILGTTIRLGAIVINSMSLVVLLVVVVIFVFKWRPPVWLVIPAAGIVNFIFPFINYRL